MKLPALEPGEYAFHLNPEPLGREPAVTSRPIIVE